MAKKAGKGKGKGAVVAGGPGDKASPIKKVDTTIVLKPTGGAKPHTLTLSPLGRNRVRFSNAASRGLTVDFQYWPFLQAPGLIQVEAGKNSKWFDILVPKDSEANYTYSIIPDLSSGDDNPDPPGISFE